jgi:erythromycin esterase-like protein
MAARSRTAFVEPESSTDLGEDLRLFSRPLDNAEDLDPLLEAVGEARYVLLGEASHGTAEFYDWRRRISQRLIQEKGFSFIAVEGDWPDCYRLNRYVKGRPGAGSSAREVLHEFERWPTWMWANEEVVDLAEWLRQRNELLPEEKKVGFYGLDVYSLWESMRAVLQYLEAADGQAAAAARRAFECFEPYGYDVEQYARATLWAPASCEADVVRLLEELRRKSPAYQEDGREEQFNAQQNALVIQNAERYYRTMIRGDAASWNIRDRHMVETLNQLVAFHGTQSKCKAIVWEHNTHIGDARYTDMAASGMINVGQLVRQQHAKSGVVAVGFSTYRGTVIAGDYWGAAMRKMPAPPARRGSWDEVLHEAIGADSLLVLAPGLKLDGLLEPRGQRAIGVVYRPDRDAYANYVPTVLPRRYDVLAHLEETHALHPLHVPASFEHEVPETYPAGV